VRGRLDRLAMGASEDAANAEQRPLGWTEGWRAAWSIRTVRYISYAQPFTTSVTVGLTILTPFLYSQKFHLAPFSRGLIISLVTAPAVVGLAMSGPVADRILAYKPGRVMVMLAGVSVLNALGLLIFIYTPFLPLAVA